MGLVDAIDDEDFDLKLESCIDKWATMEISATNSDAKPIFPEWFKKNYADVMKKSMLASTRRCAGLGGEPTSWYTNNDPESIHRKIKDEKRNQKKNMTIPDFILHLEQEVAMQYHQEELAVIRRGEYHLREQYRFLEIKEDVWFAMSPERRQRHLERLRRTAVKALSASTTRSSSRIEDDDQKLLDATGGFLSVERVTTNDGRPTAGKAPAKISTPPGSVNITSIPFTVVTSMWQKAERLLATPGSIGKPIGTYFSDGNAHLVASESKLFQPHFVYVHDTGRVTCENCPSFNKHTVAAAEKMGKLQKVLQWRRSNGTPNLDKAVRASWPKSIGSKPKSSQSKGSRKPREAVKEIHDVGTSSASGAVRKSSTQSSPQPWRAGTHPFEITFWKDTRSKICAGCRSYFEEEEPAHGLILRRCEKDWIGGTNKTKITPTAQPRAYHIDLDCIKRRHPDFGSTSATTLVVSTSAATKLTTDQLGYVESILGVSSTV